MTTYLLENINTTIAKIAECMARDPKRAERLLGDVKRWAAELADRPLNQAQADAVFEAEQAKLREAGEPVFWYRPCGDGLYEGPVHNNSVGGKMLRDEKPDEWFPLYAAPRVEAREPVLTKYQPCGCVICTCEDENQCHGCGAKHCGNHPIDELSDPVYAAPQASAKAVYVEGGRESVDDALEVVESFGPGIEGLNDNYARQVILAAEVRRLRGIYESAVKGRQDFRNALRAERALNSTAAKGSGEPANALPESHCQKCGMKVLSKCSGDCPMPDAYADRQQRAPDANDRQDWRADMLAAGATHLGGDAWEWEADDFAWRLWQVAVRRQQRAGDVVAWEDVRDALAMLLSGATGKASTHWVAPLEDAATSGPLAKMRAALAAQKAGDGDARDADPLQGAADWLVAALAKPRPTEIAARLLIGYNRAQRLYDAAMQQQNQENGNG